MFKIALEDTVTFPVKLKFKQSDRNRQFDFTVTANRVDQERIKEELEQKEKPISDFLKTVVTGWKGQRLVLNEDDTPADFSEGAFDAMLNVAGSGFTIYQAYLKALSPEKLRQAARLQAQGLLLFGDGHDNNDDADDNTQELQEQARALGVDPAMLDEQAAPDPDGHASSDVFYLWPSNLPAFQFWQKCQSQWLVGWQGPTGLNYSSVDVLLRRNGYRGKAADRMFAVMQHMEAGALDGFALKQKRTKR